VNVLVIQRSPYVGVNLSAMGAYLCSKKGLYSLANQERRYEPEFTSELKIVFGTAIR